jgi:hypothetical protein
MPLVLGIAPSYDLTERGWRFADVNGDGLTDLMASFLQENALPSALEGYLLLGRADGLFHRVKYPFLPPAPILYYKVVDADVHVADAGTRLVDLNGDFCVDLVQGFGPQVPTRWINKLLPGDKLTRITASLGSFSDITYSSPPLGASLTYPDWSKEREGGAPAMVVSTLTTYAKGGGTKNQVSKVTYEWASPKLAFSNDRGLEFRGFEKTITTEMGYEPGAGGTLEAVEVAKRRTTHTYHISAPLVGQVKEMTLETLHYNTDTSAWESQWVQQESTVVEHHSSGIGVSLTPPYQVPVKSVRKYVYDGTTPYSTLVEYWPTAYGVPWKEVQSGREDLSGDEVTIERIYGTNLASWVIARVVTEHVHTGTSLSHDTSFYYDKLETLGLVGTKGMVHRKVTTATGVSLPDETTYEYDAYGNLVSSIRSAVATGMAPTTSSMTYDSLFHQFPLQTP